MIEIVAIPPILYFLVPSLLPKCLASRLFEIDESTEYSSTKKDLRLFR